MCEHELHHLYPHACPGCNPEAYEALLNDAPEGQEQAAETTGENGIVHHHEYSDTY